LRPSESKGPRVESTVSDTLDGMPLPPPPPPRSSAIRPPVTAELQRRLQAASDATRGRARPRVAVVQWPDPLFAAGGWVPQLVALAGATDVLGRVEAAATFTPAQLAGGSHGHWLAGMPRNGSHGEFDTRNRRRRDSEPTAAMRSRRQPWGALSPPCGRAKGHR
jgi:hypothetical protein